MRGMAARGVSLLEILVFLAVLALLLGLGGSWWQGLRQELRLREAVAQFSTDLARARAEARRQSQDWRVEVREPGGSYWMGPAGNLVERNLPGGVSFSGAGQVTFVAPYGLLDVADRQFTLGLGTRTVKVNVVGLTGKVVIQREP